MITILCNMIVALLMGDKFDKAGWKRENLSREDEREYDSACTGMFFLAEMITASIIMIHHMIKKKRKGC